MSAAKYVLLPFEFKRHSDGRVLVVNECGDSSYLSNRDFDCLTAKDFASIPEDVLHSLESRHMISNEEQLDMALELLANKYRSRREYLKEATSLHMMVVTLRCNHRCEYCQVSSEADDAHKFDMQPNVAEKIVDLIFQTPSPVVKIEFQGGDALLNWDAVMAAVRHAEELNKVYGKTLEFVACTNLFALTKRHVADMKVHNIKISTSLDGPCWMHDKHRILRSGGSSYSVFVEKLKMARKALGYDCANALMTATQDSIRNVREIIDEYISLGFEGVFFRALNPYGDATNSEMFYSAKDFFDMYKEGLEYIIDLNKRGRRFVEYYTALLLRRILTPYPTHFVDLQSPSGAGVSGVIYDFNGDVYPADEARMLARMGDTRFRMGNVFENTYKEIFLSDVLKGIVRDSCVETIPGCATCAYRVYCGVDVFRNYLEAGDIAHVRTDGFFCQKHTMIFDYLLHKIQDVDFLKVVGPWMEL